MSDKNKQILEAFLRLSPAQQRRFLAQLAKSTHQTSGRRPWLKWRVWYADPKRVNGRDFMHMYARDSGEAVELCEQVRHTKLQVFSVELMP